MSDIVTPGPSSLYVLLDEHPDSINAGGFANQMVENEAQAHIIDFPASYHNGAAGISFADGHAEIRKWVDPRTRAKMNRRGKRELMQAHRGGSELKFGDHGFHGSTRIKTKPTGF